MTFPPLKSPLKFYAVVPTADWVGRMVKAGADTVQLRCKTLHGDELKREIARCVAACQGSRTQLSSTTTGARQSKQARTACISDKKTWTPPTLPPSPPQVCAWV